MLNVIERYWVRNNNAHNKKQVLGIIRSNFMLFLLTFGQDRQGMNPGKIPVYERLTTETKDSSSSKQKKG